ncbi:hypothetical protein A0J61_10959 [Choanephora cucurbitarum]|uniref:Uncharacterized protein n=1 Tax=Choanephora cucurbitarum TaxID=101091 RepID=A0A1C7MVX8_9FUNG|nr:hypothetical protein A0J61_10959 [Choanephora cucurbitarum]
MFISFFFSPIANHTFGSFHADMLKIDMQDKHMSSCSMKPDYLVSLLSDEGEQLDLFCMEAKTPEANKGDVDFIKLANSMKLMVDELVSRGCPLVSAVSFGSLLHGATMITYEMRLAHKATYLMKEISMLPMPCSFEHLGLLLPMISSIMYISETIENHQELIAALKA